MGLSQIDGRSEPTLQKLASTSALNLEHTRDPTTESNRLDVFFRLPNTSLGGFWLVEQWRAKRRRALA